MAKARVFRSVKLQAVFGFAAPKKKRGPRRTKDSSVPHGSREEMEKSGVAHVTVKLKGGFKSLRRKEEMAVVKAAIARVNAGEDVRVVEFSVMSNHIHLIVEAENSGRLSKGMASLNTGLGMRLNRLWGRVRQGSVFAERFHMEVIKSPTQMRNVLAYVLRNDVHHGLGLGTLDPCSSAISFGGFRELQGGGKPACVSVEAQTWLLRVGWKKGGSKGLLSVRDLPRVTRVLQA